MTILIFLAVFLGIMVLVRLMNIVQLSTQVSGYEETEDDQIKENNITGFGLMLFMIVGLSLTVLMIVVYSPHLLPVAATEHGVGLDQLLKINWIVIGFVFFVTQITLFYFANKYRHTKGRKAFFYPMNHKLEIVWTAIPTIVLSILIITGLREWHKILMTENKDAVNVQVYGYQFAWITRYSGKDNVLGKSNYKLITDDNPLGLDTSDPAMKDDVYTTGNEMHIPLGKEIRFQFNARDVIHSAYFPHFRAQMNLVPGMNTFFSFKPTITTDEMRKITKNENFDYVLLCNKVCGVGHFNMKMKVVVDTPEDFNKWVRKQKKAKELLSAPAVAETNTSESSAPATL